MRPTAQLVHFLVAVGVGWVGPPLGRGDDAGIQQPQTIEEATKPWGVRMAVLVNNLGGKHI
jgi:hypothetical protein